MIATRRAALAAGVLLLAALLVGCGYFESDEAHLAPRTPLLPPTSESLSAPVDLTPASVREPSPTGGAPAESSGAAAERDSAEPAPGDNETADGEPAPGDDPAGSGADGDGDGAEGPQLLEIIVIGELPHDTEAFTQGFEISGDRLYESTGARADRSSTLRELDRDTGEELRRATFEEDFFAEGITFVDERVYQLTWKDGVALVWDPEDLTILERFEYEGQGWGLCYNGRVLVMSDGSAELHFRDPVSFERAGNPLLVTLDGQELPSLNELECVGSHVWANVWQTDLIVRIDPVTGRVLALADASNIGLPRPDDPNAVLNGIAWDPDTETFLITGKDWPAIYEIRFEPASAPNNDPRRLNP